MSYVLHIETICEMAFIPQADLWNNDGKVPLSLDAKASGRIGFSSPTIHRLLRWSTGRLSVAGKLNQSKAQGNRHEAGIGRISVVEQFRIVLDQLIGMGVMMVVGIICVKTKILGGKAMDGLCAFILKIGIPFVVFANAVDGTTRQDLVQSGSIMVLDLVYYAIIIALTLGVGTAMGLRAERRRMFSGSFVFGNVGFMGLPLFLALYPSKGALFFALMSLVDQSMMWTYGVWTSKRVGDHQSRADDAPAANWLARIRSVLSPALVAVALAIIVILIGIRIPADVLAPIKTIGSTASPLSMVYLGGLVVMRHWTGVLRKPELYVGVVVKMLALPLAVFALFTQVPPLLGFTLDMDIVHTITLCSGMPTMVAMVMFAEREHNNPEYAVGMVVATTIISLFTLSAVSFLVF